MMDGRKSEVLRNTDAERGRVKGGEYENGIASTETEEANPLSAYPVRCVGERGVDALTRGQQGNVSAINE